MPDSIRVDTSISTVQTLKKENTEDYSPTQYHCNVFDRSEQFTLCTLPFSSLILIVQRYNLKKKGKYRGLVFDSISLLCIRRPEIIYPLYFAF